MIWEEIYMDKTKFSRPLSLKNVQITDTFWKKEMELVRTEVIPYQWRALNDEVEGAAPSFCMHNFKGRLALRGVLVGQQQADRIRKEERKEQNLKSRFIHFVDLRRFRKTLDISKTSSTDLYFKTVIFINGLKQLDIL
jgi:hypothetical protein